MLDTVVLGYIILFICIYIYIRDLTHPALIVCGMWLLILIMYQGCAHPLWNLSYKFFFALHLWILPFVTSSIITSKSINKYVQNATPRKFNLIRYNKMYPIAVLYSIIFVLSIGIYGGGLSIHQTKAVITGNIPTFINILLYLNTLLTAYTLYGILNYKQVGKKKVIFLLICLLFMSLFKGNKTSFLNIFVGIFFILKYRQELKFKYIIIAVIILLALLASVSLGRADYDFESDSAWEMFIYIYFLSPLTAFDSFINHEVTLSSGAPMSGTLNFFYNILNAIGFNFEIAEVGTWINVPLPTNVFTIMRRYYVDGGYPWIAVMAVVQGSIWGGLYVLQKKKHMVFVLFYATMLGALFFQSFDDYFIAQLSIVIQYYLCSVFIVRGVKFKRLTN